MRGVILAAALLLAAPAAAQAQGPDADRISAQAQAMRPLAWMDGVWRGTLWAETSEGRQEFVHTERVGPMIAGSLKVIEGRSFTKAGGTEPGLEALAVIGHDADRGLVMRSYAQGRATDHPVTLAADGWDWTSGAVAYRTRHKDGVWTERGDYAPPGGGPSRQVFGMELRRIGPTGWPAEGAVPPR